MFKKETWMLLTFSMALVVGIMVMPSKSFAAAKNVTENNMPSTTFSTQLDQGVLVGEHQAKIKYAPSSTTVNVNSENVKAVNTLLAEKGKTKLPQNTTSIKFNKNGTSMVTTADGKRIAIQKGFWGSAWKVTKCAAFITMAVVPVFKAYKAVKALGGVTQTAKLLVGAGNASDFMEIAGGAAAEILGISGIRRNCF
ncbi:hypothetical protein [Tuberibacillus sp. Marseille-P3662]|uniref:hypothetical protein n=1 Tax=Tuberibacillus sp. Marseille-P3662 TaxID=1965358 RepID=UPI000A1C8C99|nr:hypothetical protein [Tuberibacillus sp. Marseille-P3662]